MTARSKSRLQALLMLRYDLIAKPHQCSASVRLGSDHADIECMLMSSVEHKSSAACCTAKPFD